MPGKVPREGMKTESVFCTKVGNCDIVEVNTDMHGHHLLLGNQSRGIRK